MSHEQNIHQQNLDTANKAAEKVARTFRKEGSHEALSQLQQEFQDHAGRDPAHFKKWSADTTACLTKSGVLPELAYGYGRENYDQLKSQDGSMYASSIREHGLEASDKTLAEAKAPHGRKLGDEKFKNLMMHTLAGRIENGSPLDSDPTHGAWGGLDVFGLNERHVNKEDLDDRVRAAQKGMRAEAGLKGPLAHLYDKGHGGQSLYDRIRDENGNIRSGAIDKELQRTDLSREDRRTLDYLKDQKSNNLEVGNSWNHDLEKTDLWKLAIAQEPTHKDEMEHFFQKGKTTAGASEPFSEPAPFHRHGAEAGPGTLGQGKGLALSSEPSLYDRLKAPDGSIRAGAIENELAKKDLSDHDREALEYLNSQRSFMSRFSPIGSGADLSEAQLRALAKDNGLSDTYLKSHGFGHESELKNLFAKDAAGHSLYERIRDVDGNIRPGAINDELSRFNVNEKNRKTLEYLKSQETFWEKINFLGNDLDKTQVKRLAKDAGLTDEYLRAHGLNF